MSTPYPFAGASTSEPVKSDVASDRSFLPLHRNEPPARLLRRTASFWDRFNGRDKVKVPSWGQSIKAIATSSWLNLLLIAIPLSWAAHYLHWSKRITFGLSLVAIVPLEVLFDFGGEQIAMYLGESFGNLILVTLDNAVEAALAIILLLKCDIRLLQATVIGVVLLHVLFVPGMGFIIGGAKVMHQHLNIRATELNKSLLAISVLSLLIPAAFFAAIGNNMPFSAAAEGVAKQATENATVVAGEAAPAVHEAVRRSTGDVVGFLHGHNNAVQAVSDASRDHFLKLSRGLAILLLIMLMTNVSDRVLVLSLDILSRIYMHNPPGHGNSNELYNDAPEVLRRKLEEEEEELLKEAPKMNPWSCILLFIVTIPLTIFTAEFLVDSIEEVRETTGIKEEWFGLILLPFVSFSAEALVAIGFFIRTVLLRRKEQEPDLIAKGRQYDLSIQFVMFWMPILILVAWWSNKPLSMLFDLYEVALVIAACFLVNIVNDDAKTNWAEGAVLVGFYLMIVVATWFYDGQQSLEIMSFCDSVGQAAANFAAGPVAE